MGDGAITTDEFGRITRVNTAARKILGFYKTELIGKHFMKALVAETFEGDPISIIDRPITQAFITGKPAAGKVNYRTKTGKLLPVDVNVSPIMIDGRPVGAIEVFRDISIEQEVDRMKSEFISLASHQLRTPLTAIKTYTHMLNDGYMGKLSKPQRDSLQTVIGATDRMNELISILLNITRVENGTLIIRQQNVNLKTLIDEITPELALLANSKSINLATKFTGDGPINIKTDASILEQIIANLMTNALKYTPRKGRVSLTIELEKDTVLFKVRDNGWGIPDSAKSKVFTKFFRASNIVQHEANGTGLGLYLIKGLMEILGGRVWFRSTLDKGSTFYVRLPRRPKTAIVRN